MMMHLRFWLVEKSTGTLIEVSQTMEMNWLLGVECFIGDHTTLQIYKTTNEMYPSSRLIAST